MIEAVVVRDPDGEISIDLFVDGGPAKIDRVYEVDAGRGYAWDDWKEHRDECFRSASSTVVLDRLVEAFDDPPGGEYVEEVPDGGWMADTGGEESVSVVVTVPITGLQKNKVRAMGDRIAIEAVGDPAADLADAVRMLFVDPDGPSLLIRAVDGWTVEVKEDD